jgi:hypothetical protein
MLTGLRRTAVGQFRIEDAVTLAALPRTLRQGDLSPIPAVVEPTTT